MLRAKALAVIVTATALLLSSVGAEAAQNVLLIIVDDLRPELPVYGSSRIKAPHIESLAESGVVFANAYSNVPVCGASRASLMTGLRPTRQRFVDYQARADEDAPDVMPLHAWLKSRGYIAESIGKVLHHAPDSAAGWSRRPWAPQAMVPRERRTGHSNYYLQKNIDAFHNNGAGPAFEIADVGDEAYFDGQIAAYAVDSLRRLADQGKPFFLAVGFVKPHLPFTAPRDYWKLYERSEIELATHRKMPQGIPDLARHEWGELRKYSGIPAAPEAVADELARTLRHGYYASVSYVDAQVGKVLDELTALDLADETIVVLIGDHGWSLGEHGLWAKHSPFDVATRAPAIVRAPGQPKTGISTGLVEFVDIYPTLAALLDITPPEHLQGDSFVAQILDPDAPGKAAVFPRWKTGEVVKTDSFSMTTWYDDAGEVRERMLFDHEGDRDETRNLVTDPDYAGVVRQLDAILSESIQTRQ